MNFDFDKTKNEILLSEREVSFEMVIEIIAEKGVLANIRHPNPEKYPNQFMFIVEMHNYTYCVPYVIDGDTIFLKTIFPNRNYLFLLQENDNEEN